MTFDRLPSSRLIVSVLRTSTSRTRSSARCGQHEVVAANLRGGLQLAIDAAVALLDAPGVPRHVEVEEVGAVRLEVQALASGVGRDEDAQRIFGGIGVEAPLDLLARLAAGQAGDDRDALVGAIGRRDRLLEDLLQVALRALAVLGEDEHAAVVPPRGLALSTAGRARGGPGTCARGSSRSGARPSRRERDGALGDPLHLVQQRALCGPLVRRGCVAAGRRLGGLRHAARSRRPRRLPRPRRSTPPARRRRRARGRAARLGRRCPRPGQASRRSPTGARRSCDAPAGFVRTPRSTTAAAAAGRRRADRPRPACGLDVVAKRCLAGTAVLVEQPRQLELRRVAPAGRR